MAQQSLFPEASTVPDVIAICDRCGREIVVRSITPGHVYSEYRDNGLCYACCFPKKEKHGSGLAGPV